MKNQSDQPEFIFVFRTNIILKKDVKRLAPSLDSNTGIVKWSLDLADIDRVLRIESTCLGAFQIMQMVAAAGYLCEELTD